MPKLFHQHKGWFTVKSWPSGDPSNLTPEERSTIGAILKFYGKKPGHVLAALTHRERPWRDARAHAGLGPGERGSVVITKDSMLDYYEGLVT